MASAIKVMMNSPQERLIESKVQDEPVQVKKEEQVKKKQVIMPFVKYGGLKFLEQNADNNSPLCIVASTGAGKSTSLAKFYAERARSAVKDNNQIKSNTAYDTLMLIPGRAATRAIYKFMTAMSGRTDLYAYSIGGKENEGNADAPVRFVTAGWALAKLADPTFSWRTLVLDEAHTPSKDYYLLRKIAKFKLANGQRFKMIVCSATIAAGSFEVDFPGLITYDFDMSAKYKNEIRYCEADLDGVHEKDVAAICGKVLEVQEDSPHGDKLVFCDGERTVVDVASFLESRLDESVQVCTLYGAMEPSDITEILETKYDGVTIYVVTNMVESSITIPRITHVVCSGVQKTMYIDGTGRKDLRTESCSQSSLMQQRGRGMRVPVHDPEGNLIIGYTTMMMTKEKWDVLRLESMRDVDSNALHEPIMQLLGLGYSPEVLMDDISPARIARDKDYLLRYGLLAPAETEGELPVPTPLGKAATTIATDIPNARVLYLTAKELIEDGYADMVWPAVFMIARSNMVNGPFYYPKRDRGLSAEAWKAKRQDFTAQHFLQYFGHDDIETSLTVYRMYTEHHNLDNNNKQIGIRGKYKIDYNWLRENHFSSRFFESMRRTIDMLLRNLRFLGLRFPVHDTHRPYDEISSVVWPAMSAYSGIFTESREMQRNGTIRSFYLQRAAIATEEDRDFELNTRYSMDAWHTVDDGQYPMPVFLVAFQVRSIRVTGKAPFYTLSVVFGKCADYVDAEKYEHDEGNEGNCDKVGNYMIDGEPGIEHEVAESWDNDDMPPMVVKSAPPGGASFTKSSVRGGMRGGGNSYSAQASSSGISNRGGYISTYATRGRGGYSPSSAPSTSMRGRYSPSPRGGYSSRPPPPPYSSLDYNNLPEHVSPPESPVVRSSANQVYKRAEYASPYSIRGRGGYSNSSYNTNNGGGGKGTSYTAMPSSASAPSMTALGKNNKHRPASVINSNNRYALGDSSPSADEGEETAE